MAKVHPTAVVDPKALLAEGVEVGPYCVIGPQVKVGAATVFENGGMGNYQIQYIRSRHALPITRDYLIGSSGGSPDDPGRLRGR